MNKKIIDIETMCCILCYCSENTRFINGTRTVFINNLATLDIQQ